MKCRHCSSQLDVACLDLGTAPPSNSYLTQAQLSLPESYFPLRLLLCESCFLVQTEDFAQRESLFTEDYAYFSSYSSSWLAHAQTYVQAMQERFSLNAESLVVEIAANDGYLLQYVRARGIPCYGIEPTTSTAAVAKQRGIEIIEEFFGEALGSHLREQGKQADLIAANNVLAHVPDINDFVRGFACLLKPTGVATFEFPHLLNMVQLNQFDTAYHEHYSYLSLTAVKKIFEANGLRVFDVEQLNTHGGSLRVYAQTGTHHTMSERVADCLEQEKKAGMLGRDFYLGFQSNAERAKYALLEQLIQFKRDGLTVAAYGAAAKGNTFLNFAGIRTDLMQFVVDKNPQKQGKYLPGSRAPIVDIAHLKQQRPDRIIIFPWNLEREITQELSFVREWGAQFVIAIPQLRIF
ncbi:class I SAM-dependent methyltransferase [Undibacterium flavidum]|uniref:Class I SAM-dependent methyltransferase n=1 Tax=Undibacterium flavidum TaxID=2762297 RepID=A0ABR6Y6R8_9BURK|nr:class I SAM-dependent methyltransferase [Undibacterium flavidum]MBC3872307.1 class I SAM-dependent methyltransferase [Undibacterium flavidum]